MTKLKVGIVQTRPSMNFDRSLKLVLALSERLAEAGADIICLPEAWHHPLPYSNIDEMIGKSNEILEKFRLLSDSYGITILPGAIYEEIDKERYITSPILDKKGNILGRQHKVHLYLEETKFFKTNKKYNVFSINGYKIGILICHDIVFPETARLLSLKNADLIFNPSKIESDGIDPWKLYLKVRCLENRIPIVGVNVSIFPEYPGQSVLYQPKQHVDSNVCYPEETIKAEKRVQIFLGEIDLDIMRKLRSERFKERIPEAYK